MTLLIIFGTLGLGLLAQLYVKAMLAKYGAIAASSGYTGAEVAAEILRRNGVAGVSIHEHDGFLGDHYDPINRRLVLSRDIFHGTSLAAIGVAAHEAGHALQHKEAYAPLHLRMLAVGVTNFAHQAVTWLTFFLMASHYVMVPMGLTLLSAAWGVIMLFNLITLPVEYDASRRAKDMLQRLGFVRTAGEAGGVATVLNAAALTYVAAFVGSLAYFLLYILPLLGGGRNRD